MISLEKIKKIASARGNDICVVVKEKNYTWQDILVRTESHVAFLKRMYSKEQLRSACYLSKNSVDVICWLAAFATLGIPANGLDYSLPVDRLAMLIKRINPDILLVSFNLYSPEELNMLNTTGSAMLAIDALTDPIIKSIGEHHAQDIDNLLSGHVPPVFRAVSLTSGTSSLPKIALRYRSFDTRRFNWFTGRYGFNSDDGFMLILPLYHAAGNGWARMFMGLGSPIYIVDQDDNSDIINCLSQRNVTASVMTPNLVSKLTHLAENVKYQSHLRWVLVGGSYFSVNSKQAAIKSFGSVFYEYYGCTESGVNVLSEPTDMLNYPQSVGKVFDGNQVLILDENNNPLAAGNNGRVAIASYMLMDEYADGTRPFVNIGDVRYFLMADHGYLDRQGRLFLMNRNGDSNNNSHIYQMEENIRGLPCISDVAVISVVEDGKSCIKCIYSTKHEEKDKVEKLMSIIKQKFQNHNVKNIRPMKVDKIPYSPSGKVRFNDVVKILSAA